MCTLGTFHLSTAARPHHPPGSHPSHPAPSLTPFSPQTLDAVQVARLAVHSWPFFPSVCSMALMLYRKRGWQPPEAVLERPPSMNAMAAAAEAGLRHASLRNSSVSSGSSGPSSAPSTLAAQAAAVDGSSGSQQVAPWMTSVAN